MIDAVLHLLEHRRREQVSLLDRHVVAQGTGIAQRDFLVPALLARRVFAPERIDTRDVEHHVREAQ